MTRMKRAAVGALAIALAAAPVATAWAGGYNSHYGGRNHYGHRYYGNPLYPVAGLAAAVVGTAAAIVTLPFAILGAAAAQVPAYYPPAYPSAYPPAPAPRNYYPPQANVAPGYGSQGYGPPHAYYPAPVASNAYPPPQAQHSYPSRATYDAPRYPQYGDLDDYRGPAVNNGYYRQDAPPGGYYAPRRGSYGSPYADSYSYSSPNQH